MIKIMKVTYSIRNVRNEREAVSNGTSNILFHAVRRTENTLSTLSKPCTSYIREAPI